MAGRGSNHVSKARVVARETTQRTRRELCDASRACKKAEGFVDDGEREWRGLVWRAGERRRGWLAANRVGKLAGGLSRREAAQLGRERSVN